MKKKLLALMIVSIMSLPLTATAMATEAVAEEPNCVTAEQEILPHSEILDVWFRNYNGRLQYRIWSVTFGVWRTEWRDV